MVLHVCFFVKMIEMIECGQQVVEWTAPLIVVNMRSGCMDQYTWLSCTVYREIFV